MTFRILGPLVAATLVCLGCELSGSETCDDCGVGEEASGGAGGGGVEGDPVGVPCPLTEGLQEGAAWPMAGGCPRHQRRSPYVGPSEVPEILWTANIGSGRGEILIARDGTLFLGAVEGPVKISPTGEVTQLVEHESDSMASPAIGADGTVYFPTGKSGASNYLYALSPHGDVRWRYDGEPEDWRDGATFFEAGVVIDDDGNLFTGESLARLFRISPDGDRDWIFEARHGFSAPVGIDPSGTLVALSDDGCIYWLDIADGSVKATRCFDGQAPGVLIGDEGNVYIGTYDSAVYGVDSDGTILWQVVADQAPVGQMALGADGTLFVPVPSAYQLLAINAQTGELLWTVKFDDWIFSATVGGDGTVYVIADALHALDPSDGSEQWRWLLDGKWGPVGAVTIGADGTLYVELGEEIAALR